MIFTRYDPDKDDDEDENEVAVVNPKSDEQRTRLNAACNKVLLFNRYVPCLRWRNYNIYFFQSGERTIQHRIGCYVRIPCRTWSKNYCRG